MRIASCNKVVARIEDLLLTVLSQSLNRYNADVSTRYCKVTRETISVLEILIGLQYIYIKRHKNHLCLSMKSPPGS